MRQLQLPGSVPKKDRAKDYTGTKVRAFPAETLKGCWKIKLCEPIKAIGIRGLFGTPIRARSAGSKRQTVESEPGGPARRYPGSALEEKRRIQIAKKGQGFTRYKVTGIAVVGFQRLPGAFGKSVPRGAPAGRPGNGHPSGAEIVHRYGRRARHGSQPERLPDRCRRG